MTSCQVNGSQNDRLTCVVGSRYLWTPGSHAGKKFSLALGVVVKIRGLGGTKDPTED